MKSNLPHPPRTPRWLLHHLSDYQERFSIEGDLEEVFHEIGQESGYRRARRWYWQQSVNSLPKYMIYLLSWSFAMFKNYLKTALRNIVRQRIHAVINIIGLSLGLASCILIYLFIKDEISYDRFHDKADSIYAVVCRNEFHGESGVWAIISMAPVMEEYFPEIQNAIRLNTRNQATVRYRDKIFNENPVFTDPAFFKVFTFPLIQGNPETALQSKNSVVLTQSKAIKYFGSEQPFGQSLTMIFGETKKEFLVSGIAKDTPENSTVDFDILLNLENLADIRGPDYLTNKQWFDTGIYMLLDEASQPSRIESRFPAFVKQYYKETLEEWRSSGGWTGEGDVFSFTLQNIKTLHLNPILRNVGASDIKRSAILAGIALLILAIACINFINLSIGRASGRAREIGMRKIIGATRTQLIRQFWTESLVLIFLAMTASLLIASLILPIFNQLAEKSLSLDSFLNMANLLAFLAIMIFVAIASGSFPAMVMSGFHPVEILKGKLKIGRKTVFTKSLVVVQFSLSIFLIIITLTMAKQINAMSQKNLGFRKEGVVVIRMQESDWLQGQKTEALIEKFRNTLRGYSDVRHVSGSMSTFNRLLVMSHITIKGKTYDVYSNKVYHDYLKTMGIKIVEGRDFSREFPTDREAVLVNQKFVRQYDFEHPLGETIWEAYNDSMPLRIIGVVEDYHIQSPRHEIEPIILHIIPNVTIFHILVRISLENIPETIALLEKTWKDIHPDKPFLFSFIEEDIDAAYGSQKKWHAIVRYSSILAVLITCMGIFALTALTISRRVKEIGIRKVLGASVIQIANMVYREFLLLIIIANAIAWPIAYYTGHTWLQGFAFRVGMGPELFLLAGALTLLIAIGTISYLAVKAALSNPVESIRTE